MLLTLDPPRLRTARFAFTPPRRPAPAMDLSRRIASLRRAVSSSRRCRRTDQFASHPTLCPIAECTPHSSAPERRDAQRAGLPLCQVPIGLVGCVDNSSLRGDASLCSHRCRLNRSLATPLPQDPVFYSSSGCAIRTRTQRFTHPEFFTFPNDSNLHRRTPHEPHNHRQN